MQQLQHLCKHLGGWPDRNKEKGKRNSLLLGSTGGLNADPERSKTQVCRASRSAYFSACQIISNHDAKVLRKSVLSVPRSGRLKPRMLLCQQCGDRACLTPGELAAGGGPGGGSAPWGLAQVPQRLCLSSVPTWEAKTMLRKCWAGAAHETHVCTWVQAAGETPRKKHAARGFGRHCWIYGSLAVGDEPPKPEKHGCGGQACRQAPRGRLWRTAEDPHTGRGRAGACRTQMRQRQAKKGSFEPIIFIWRKREPGEWESWGCTCACMKGREAESSQPARLRKRRGRGFRQCLLSKTNHK